MPWTQIWGYDYYVRSDSAYQRRYVYEIKEATTLVLKNLLSIVEAGGGCRESVARVDVYIRDLKDFDLINEAYTVFFGGYKPARVCVQVAALPADVPLEASMIAFQSEEV